MPMKVKVKGGDCGVRSDSRAEVLCRLLPGVVAVYLFGSRASGEAAPDSDLDLAVLARDAIDPQVVQSAREASIDLAMHLVRRHRLGLPQQSREAFDLLEDAGLIDPELARSMRAMVGFRNVAVHTYRDLDLEIVRAIIRERLTDFERFTARVLRDAASLD